MRLHELGENLATIRRKFPEFYEMVPGFASALLIAIIVSLVTYKKNETIDEEFDRAVELAKVK